MNAPYHLALRTGYMMRRAAARLLPLRRPGHNGDAAGIRVVSFSSAADVAEQLACIRSFVRNAGFPQRWTIVSDGSHDRRQIASLRSTHPAVEVIPWDVAAAGAPAPLLSYAGLHPLGKKLAVLACAGESSPFLYVDSDVLFFKGAGRHLEDLGDSGSPRYLPDCSVALDEELLPGGTLAPGVVPVNSGVLWLTPGFDWEPAVETIARAGNGHRGRFVEQTAVHVATHANRGRPLDRQRYVMSVEDQFRFWDCCIDDDTVLRHYVSSIRHKFWFHPRPPRVG